MLALDGAAGVALLVLWIYCLFDAITSDPALVRNLPRWAWIVLVLLLPDVGSLLWLLAGRPRRRPAGATAQRRPGYSPGFPETERDRWLPRREEPRREPPRGPDDDEDFLRRL